jgi:hypothetical protein
MPVARMGKREVHAVLVGKGEGTRPLGKPRSEMGGQYSNRSSGGGMGAWTGLVWLRIGTGRGLL